MFSFIFKNLFLCSFSFVKLLMRQVDNSLLSLIPCSLSKCLTFLPRRHCKSVAMEMPSLLILIGIVARAKYFIF